MGVTDVTVTVLPTLGGGGWFIQEQESLGVTLEFCLSQSLMWQASPEEMAPLSRRPSLKKVEGGSWW